MEQGQTEVITAEEFIGELTGGYSREIIGQMTEIDIRERRKKKQRKKDAAEKKAEVKQK